MSSSIYDFSAKMVSSVRPSQFRVHINFPASLVSNANIAKNTAIFLTNQAQIPSYNTMDVEIFYRGRIFHEAGEKTYDTWTCSIYNNVNHDIRAALEEWVNEINDPEVVKGITIPSIYKTNIYIEQMDRNDNTLRVYKLVGAYPTATGNIDLNFSDQNTIENFQVTFVYDYCLVGGLTLLESAISSQL